MTCVNPCSATIYGSGGVIGSARRFNLQDRVQTNQFALSNTNCQSISKLGRYTYRGGYEANGCNPRFLPGEKVDVEIFTGVNQDLPTPNRGCAYSGRVCIQEVDIRFALNRNLPVLHALTFQGEGGLRIDPCAIRLPDNSPVICDDACNAVLWCRPCTDDGVPGTWKRVPDTTAYSLRLRRNLRPISTSSEVFRVLPPGKIINNTVTVLDTSVPPTPPAKPAGTAEGMTVVDAYANAYVEYTCINNALSLTGGVNTYKRVCGVKYVKDPLEWTLSITRSCPCWLKAGCRFYEWAINCNAAANGDPTPPAVPTDDWWVLRYGAVVGRNGPSADIAAGNTYSYTTTVQGSAVACKPDGSVIPGGIWRPDATVVTLN